jgi:Excreted virulence factor EspC, type VII ESX diderm
VSESDATNVDLPAVLGVITQLSGLSTSLNDLAGRMQDASSLTWTGADKAGTTLYEQLAPAEQAGVQAVTATQQAVDGLVDSLGTTAGLWKNTENTNIELNQ